MPLERLCCRGGLHRGRASDPATDLVAERETRVSSGMFDVSGAFVLVTGGSKGIGLGIARGFVAAGATVFIAARHAEDCDEAARTLGSRCISVPCDVGFMDGIMKLAAQMEARAPHLNVLVNNAGATWAEPLESYPEEQWDTVVDVNLKAPFYLVQRLLPLLRKGAGPGNPARVINVGSIAGLVPMA